MTSRERFRETLLFGKPDKVPFQPGGPRESILARWHKQGLPKGVNYYEFLLKTLGIEKEKENPSDISWPNFIEYSRLLAELTGWLRNS